MQRSVFSVAQINSYIKNMFAQDYMLSQVQVRGEVSNCKYHTSGHIYFTLKDQTGTIACVMFAGNRAGLSFHMEAGMQVVVSGSVSIYERDGKYQLYAKQIKLDGIGDLYARYEQLKEELRERGMFAEEYKQPIPRYVRTLGVVTAQTGAAVRDIITVSKRRNPGIRIILYPAIVQGDAAAPSIVRGIRALERIGVDVIIVGRGGGSIEDLWAFNEESVAQAIFDCSIPIISAVGHETDTTIADWVADKRAATPSAAAELAVADRSELVSTLRNYYEAFLRAEKRRIGEYRLMLEKREARFRYVSPEGRIREQRERAMHLEEALQRAMKRKLELSKNRAYLMAQRLQAASPLEKLQQGYSYAMTDRGKNLRSVSDIEAGEHFTLYVQDGTLDAKVMNVGGMPEYFAAENRRS